MKRILTISALLLLSLQGCGSERAGQAPAGEQGEALDDLSESPVLTATEYTTSLQFLPFEPTRTRALVMQFSNMATASALERRYQAWQLGRSAWRRILDVDAQEQPIRAPWRLFPTDSMAVTVNADPHRILD